MRKVYLLFIFTFSAFLSFGQSGIYEAYTILNINGGGSIYYDMNPQTTTGNPDFNGASLGTFTMGVNTLVLAGGQNKVYKCNTDDITNGSLWYRIYKVGNTPGSFTGIPYNWVSNDGAAGCGGTNQTWEKTIASINVLNGLTPGDYKLEVYSSADFTFTSGSDTHYYNNDPGTGVGLNYIATFTVSGTVVVTSSIGTSPVNYTTLKAAFDAVNAGTHKGTIAISIYGNTTETVAAELRNSGYLGLSNYTSVSIQPTGGAARTVSGSFNGNLVDFYGATNVTVDGLNSGSNSLTFSNSNITAGTTTMRFSGEAANNTIKNCTLNGSDTGTVNSATILFLSAIGSTTGLSNITIDNCNIGAAGSNTPRYAIYGEGTTALVNTSISITNNNIYDFFNTNPLSSVNGNSSGMRLVTGNSGWTISGNKFYQTSARNFGSTGSANARYAAIDIEQTTGGTGFTISNNIIGYASSSQSGTTDIGSTNSFANEFRGIYFKGGTGTTSTIGNNTIAGIKFVTTRGATSLASPSPGFVGISVDAGTVTVTNNTIGSLTGNSSIRLHFNPSAAVSAGFLSPQSAIQFNNATSTTITGNNIGSITISSNANATNMSLGGIVIVSASGAIVSGNTIGGSSDSSINLATTSGRAVGVYLINNGTSTISTNKVSGMLAIDSLIGIGLYFSSSATIYNNFVSLGTNVSSATISGLEQGSSAATTFYYNSVRIQGTSSGAANSAGLLTGNSLSLTAKNNILYNERTGGSGTHNAIRFGSAVTYTGDYNDLYQTSGTTLGNINGTNYATLALWRTASAQDANSISSTVAFTSTTDLHTFDANIQNKGISLAGIVDFDIDGEARKPGCLGTDIGADEIYSIAASTNYVWTGKKDNSWCNECNWDKDAVPTSSNNVIIPSSYTNALILDGTNACTSASSNNITIANSAVVTLNNASTTLNVYGNFSNSGTYTHSNGNINFAGTTQSITSTSPLSFYNLNMTGGGTKTLNSNTSVTGSLGLTNGILYVPSATFAMNAGVGYTGTPGSSSYVWGSIRKYFGVSETDFTFHVGDGTRYGPVELANISGVTAGDYMDGSYSTGVFSGDHRNILSPVPAAPTNSTMQMDFASYVEYWNLNFNGGNSFAAKLNLHYTSNLYSQLYNKGADWLRVAYYNGTGVLDYGNDNPSVNQSSGSSGYISSANSIGGSAFNGVFTFGTTANGVNPLPSYFKSFSASKQTGYNKLDWNVGCQGRELTFEILRSTDGRNFIAINKFTASQSRCSQPFDFNDYDVSANKIYYRIKITDEFGKIAYTQVAVIINHSKGFEVTGLMPNPATDVVYLNISSAVKDKLQLMVTDINGRQMMNLSTVLAAGSNIIPLQVKSFAKGVYTISGIYSDGKTAALRFIKQ